MNVEDVVKAINSMTDLNDLKRIRRVVNERIRKLRIDKAKGWSNEAIRELWDRLSEDQRRLIKYLVDKGGNALKSEIIRDFGWKEMKVTGVLSGINNQARNMGFKDVVTRTGIRRNGDWDIKYSLNKAWLDAFRNRIL